MKLLQRRSIAGDIALSDREQELLCDECLRIRSNDRAKMVAHVSQALFALPQFDKLLSSLQDRNQ